MLVHGRVQGRGGGGRRAQVLLTVTKVEDVFGRRTKWQQEHVRTKL